jgi:predicted transcriptional regulator
MWHSETFSQTDKQVEIMTIILDAIDRGEAVTIKLIHSRVSYGASVRHSAINSSVNYLVHHGFLTKTRPAGNAVYQIRPTLKAYQYFRPGPIAGIAI